MTTQLEFSVPVETWIEESIARLSRDWNKWGIGFQFTADDIHGVVGNPPHHNAYGALLNTMAARKLIVCVGYTTSKRPTRNGSLIRVWRVR